MSKVFVWIGAIFLPLGLVFAGLGGWLYLEDRSLAATGARARGTVIEMVSNRDSDGDYTYRPVVEFHDSGGERHAFTGSVGSNPPSRSTGETVDVIYQPWSPENATIDSFFDRFFLPFVFTGLGTLFAGIGGGLLVAWFRRRRIIAQLHASGLPIQAKFVECYQDTSTRVNGRSPWRVTCQATHPATGKLQSFKSDPIWVDPTERMHGRDLRVLVDPARPKHYFVDLSPYLDESAMA